VDPSEEKRDADSEGAWFSWSKKWQETNDLGQGKEAEELEDVFSLRAEKLY
jgi:hypothetical protein